MAAFFVRQNGTFLIKKMLKAKYVIIKKNNVMFMMTYQILKVITNIIKKLKM